jgi:methionyl-tRNA formyltransferase
MRLIFMGTPDFAVAALRALLASSHRIVAVYTQPPRPAGRGQVAQTSPIHRLAEAVGLPVRTPVQFKDPAARAELAAFGADLAVVAAYGLILPQAILDAPRLGCVNIHASLLPRWRGAAPIQRAIEAGDAETGVTIMRMTAGLDTGPMLLAERVAIGPTMTAGELHDRLAERGAALLLRALQGLEAGTLAATPQPDAGVSYARKIEKAEARIDWRRPAAEIERRIRAFNPVPGAWFEAGGERIKALMGEIARDARPAAPGTVLDERLTIACGAGALRLLLVQRAGKAAMAAEEFLRGRAVEPGCALP